MKLKCNKCKIEKPLTIEFFKKGKTNKYGFAPQCKLCLNAYQKAHRTKNKTTVNAKRQEHYKKIPDKVRTWDQKSKANRKKRMQNDSEYAAFIRKQNLDRRNKRFKNEPSYKIGHALRTRIRKVLKNSKKVGSAVKYLGCSLNELKHRIESLWQPGMTWENYTIDGWHIDHIKPLSSFNLEDLEQFKQACHYTNLQPLWAKDNLSKSDKV
jgi:hypothetical protein